MLLLVSSATCKHDHSLSFLLHDDCTGWTVPLTSQRVQYKLCRTMHWCLQSKASEYWKECCTLISDITCLQHVQSSSSHWLFISHHQRSMLSHQTFSVAGTSFYFASAAVAVASSRMTASSSALWSRSSPPSNFVSGHVLTMWLMYVARR